MGIMRESGYIGSYFGLIIVNMRTFYPNHSLKIKLWVHESYSFYVNYIYIFFLSKHKNLYL